MKPKIIRIFIFSAGVLLFITALAKLISSTGNAHVLQIRDPILYVSFQKIFWIVGTLELVVAFICFFGKWARLQVQLIAWLATIFMLYRLGLLWGGYHRPCICMGNLTDALHIAPQTVEMIMKVVLLYLLSGSYAALFWIWRDARKTTPH